MKLFLHIGYHKTGSSFLQTNFARNRKTLIENKIYYPTANRDKDALNGLISPGNGVELKDCISNQDYVSFINIIKSWIFEAKTIGCDSILVSNEGLFHVLTLNGTEFLRKLLSDGVMEEISTLLFLRDPADHVLSLYKHRGKSGAIEDFEYWLQNDYETLRLTSEFIKQVNKSEINWNFRRYKKNSKYLVDLTFNKWLNLSSPIKYKDSSVNQSLSLNHIYLLSSLYRNGRIDYVKKLRKEFLKISNDERASDRVLKEQYMVIISLWLKENELYLNSINEYLFKQERLEFSLTNNSYKRNPENDFLNLSQKEINILISVLSKRIYFQTNIRSVFKKIISKL